MLQEYKKKRNFNKTQEPQGSGGIKGGGSRIFVAQEHHASHLHWDFRLEYQGVLKSWAVPRGIPVKKNDKRLAIEVEDHPLEYGDFAGKIPEGEYGAGVVKIWDKGKYQLLKKEKDVWEVKLKGKKLKGIYMLFKPARFNKNNWLIIKR